MEKDLKKRLDKLEEYVSEEMEAIRKLAKTSNPIEKIITYKDITSLEDIYKALKVKESDFLPYQVKLLTNSQEKQNNIARLEKAAEFYNKDWKVKFDGIQNNYYPWFGRHGGVWSVSSRAGYRYDGSYGSLVYLENNDKAVHFGKTFFDLYKKILNLQ